MRLGSLEGITAWKEGTAYLASLDLWEGVKIESFSAQFARPGVWRSGSKRLCLAVRFGQMFPLAQRRASWLWIPPFGVLTWMWPPCRIVWFSWQGRGSNSRGEVHFSRGGGHALDGEASLRLAADGFRWNKRGWESLEAGASMIHGRLTVSDLSLNKKRIFLRGAANFRWTKVGRNREGAFSSEYLRFGKGSGRVGRFVRASFR